MNLVKFILLFVLAISSFANEYFNEKDYEKALPQVQQEAKKGLKASMYRLGYMYMNGLGVKQDFKKASYWFEKSASKYRYTLSIKPQSEIKKMPFNQRVLTQINPATNKIQNEFTFDKIDIKTTEVKELLSSLADANFYGMKPYKTNYILPFSYASKKYKNGDLNTEVEFQLSFKKPLTYNFFGLHEYLSVGYTQKVWWQLYGDSAPFRETNYLPEVYFLVPTSKYIDEKLNLKFLKYSFLHESNGRDGYSSRSWNRLYIAGDWQLENLFLTTRLWYRVPETKKQDPINNPNENGDDNSDILNYMGYGDIKLNYFLNKHEFGSVFRYNFGMGGKDRGAIDLHYSYPFLNSKNTFLYIKFFNGYGESLIDYNHCVTKTSVGFSFSREVF